MDIKCSVFIAASVDGFIAREDGDIEWLHSPEYECPALNGLSYEDFMSSIDALVMGRKTLDKVLSFPEWPYADKAVIVLSRLGVSLPEPLQGKVEVLAGEPADIVAQLAARGMKHLYIDGGQTVQAFLAAGLINELVITRIPVLLGRGIPLFGPLGTEQKLRLIDSAMSDNGFVQSRYQVL
ncbi:MULTISPECIES: dihydrofolate reductase family protein [Pseudomonas]|jgi:dihydrofolate reductase|uniref:Dihydrofolate reductase n=2 Tax=Pseudomonas TaxID=286 RepID=A0A0J6KSB2_9PSED|nr:MULTISPECIES: dihydrofolate reductase family protein [Pseudomonas]KMM99587.1 deaminase/reductase [Pseudomonas helleri]MQT29638.1 dihydrofolate reductase [Pseudomonas helleri]MQT48883.1 dihydrofolate reductase [Pseudomonas helleri]MQT59538.1 dihydrofolate reductase [Pseudomonas sp. FSL R10-0399]MQT74396.1 dihydrofolate reductase [Pseudomonas helleri]